MFGIHPTHRLDMSVERLVREMDKYHITASLTLCTIGVFYDHNRGNAITLEAAKANNRLIPVATVNPTKWYGSAVDLQAVCAQGFKILKFFPDEQGWAIRSSAFAKVVEQAASLKIPIIVSIAHSGDPTDVSSVTASYPAPVVLGSVSLETLSEVVAVMEKHPSLLIGTHELHAPGALEMLVSRVGAERIVFGSGSPRRVIASSLAYVANSELSNEQKSLILGGNIKRVLEGWV
jgi:predicted TIM-barrel fold metal-dependent hydrolase